MTCVAGKVGIENTTALLKLYTRFLQCFVSARSCLAAEIAPLRFGSVQLKRIPQNAGCTMAIHAVCTTRTNFMILNQLI